MNSPAGKVFDHVRSLRFIPNAAVIILLIFLVLIGYQARKKAFHARGTAEAAPLWAESAQHFRYVEEIIDNGSLPSPDMKINHPEGFNPFTQTVLGEYAAGWIYRLFSLNNAEPDKPESKRIHRTLFIRKYVRIAAALIVFPVFLAGFYLTGSYAGSIFAAATYLFSIAAVSRSTGETFFHEHTSLLFLAFHFAFAVKALRSLQRKNALISALFLVAALLSWKVIRFYTLFLSLFLFFQATRKYRRTELWTNFILPHFLVILLFSLAPGGWMRSEYFFFSETMILLAGISFARAIVPFIIKSKKLRALRVVSISKNHEKYLFVFSCIIFFCVFYFLLGSGGNYGHVWTTFIYKLRFMQKPYDPSLLPYEARHYWVPPYTSPNLFEFLDEGIWMLLVAAYPLFVLVRKFAKGRTGIHEEFFLFMGIASIFFYLLFIKLKTVTALFLAPATALYFLNKGYARTENVNSSTVSKRRRMMGCRALVICFLCLVFGFQYYHSSHWENSAFAALLYNSGLDYPEMRYMARCTPSYPAAQMLGWIKHNSDESAAFLCEFVLSAVIPAYTGRRVNLHAYFESDVRRKYIRYVSGMFLSEKELYELCREWDADYVVYNAHILFRTDRNLSFRYVADEMAFDKDWVCYKFHFKPMDLDFFDLVYENDFFRIYGVVKVSEEPSANFLEIELSYRALFDEKLFEAHVRRDTQGRPLTGEWIYPFVSAYELRNKALVEAAQGNWELSGKYIDRAIRECPLIADLYEIKAKLAIMQEKRKEALEYCRKALELDPSSESMRNLKQRLDGAEEDEPEQSF